MPAPPVPGLARMLDSQLRQQQSLVTDAQQYRLHRARKPRALTTKELESIAELAFLKVFLAWERFLEQAFLRYVCGAKDGSVRVRCFIQAPTLQHASALVIPEGRGFVEWNNAQTVRERAKRYFHKGEPFVTALGGVSVRLEDMRKIRNVIAHQSGPAQEKFEEVVRRELGFVPPRASAGMFLLRIAGAGPSTHFEQYVETLRVVRRLIVS